MSALCGALAEFTTLIVFVGCCLRLGAMSVSPSQNTRPLPDEVDTGHGKHVKESSRRRGSSAGSRSSSSQRESSRRDRKHSRDVGGGGSNGGGGAGGSAGTPPDHFSPSTSRDEVNSPPWDMVMEALHELRADMDKLKERRPDSCGGACAPPLPQPPASAVHVNRRPTAEVSCSASTAGFSGFPTPTGEHHLSSDDDSDNQDDVLPSSVLLQCAKSYGPVDDVSVRIDGQVADMVNQVFDNGLREEEYKEILDDDSTKRPANCPALAPVECNSQVLDALKTEAKKADSRMKDVGKDIITAATIMIKSLMALDKVALDGNPDVAHEVGMLNGALALLGNANHKNNLTRRFIIKREINQKYAHLCSDKVPMTRLLFGDDVSQSAKNIEESEKLKNKFTTKKSFPTWRFGTGKRGSSGKAPYKGFATKFTPYGQRAYGQRTEHRRPFPRQGMESKNSRGRGYNTPRR